MSLVDDEIARVERERVDAVALAPWPTTPIAISSDAVAGEVGFGDDKQGAGVVDMRDN